MLHHNTTGKINIFIFTTGEGIRMLLLSKLAKLLEFYTKLPLIGCTSYLEPAK